jgi:hypothetical protein
VTALGRPARALFSAAVAALLLLGSARSALAQEEKKAPPPRDVRFAWNQARSLLYVTVSFRDVIDASIRRKLSRGLPTTIVLTATIYEAGSTEPLSTTAQTCKITWHVWDEVYLLEITRPGGTLSDAAVTVDGVLRRCAETRRPLVAGTKDQIPFGAALHLQAKVQVNPVSADVLHKIKKWVLRPTGTATAAPGDALFSTFTGLFLQRIGEAERELKFTTKTVIPTVPKPKPPPKK